MTHIVRGSKKITDDLGHFRWVCSNILVSFDFISTVWPFFSFLFFSVPSSNHHVLHPRQLPWTETTWIGWNEVLLIDFCTLICFLEVFEHVLLPWLLKASSDFVSSSRTLHFGGTLGTIFVQDFCSWWYLWVLMRSSAAIFVSVPAGFHVLFWLAFRYEAWTNQYFVQSFVT